MTSIKSIKSIKSMNSITRIHGGLAPPGMRVAARRAELGTSRSGVRRAERAQRKRAPSHPHTAKPIAAVALALATACEPTNQGYAPRQPIVYSHAVHAGGLQIPCQYCHFGAERGRYAGIPPASVCMNCHDQVVPDHPEVAKVKQALDEGNPIAWVKVHRLPDHAFFDHSVHTSAGVDCQTCHGAVESMGLVRQEAPLTMGWCVDCHRDRGSADTTALATLANGGDPARHNRLTDCVVCHH